MIELPDDELDKLFRKSSEELDPQYDPGDWDDLKKRLDQHDGKSGLARLKKWWPLGLMLLLVPVGIVAYLWPMRNSVEKTTKQRVEQQENLKSAQTARQNEKSGEQEKAGEEVNTAGEQISNDQAQTMELPEPQGTKRLGRDVGTKSAEEGDKAAETTTRKEISKPFSKSDYQTANLSRQSLPRSRSKAGGVYLEPNRSKTEGGDGALILPENAWAQKRENGFEDEGDNQVRGLRNAEERGNSNTQRQEDQVNATETEIAGERMLLPAAMLPNRQPSWNNGGEQPAVTLKPTEQTPAPAVQAEKEEVPQAKWAVRFGFSPDLSTVGGEKLTKPGTAVSLLAELSVLPRVFVQTGAVWSRKDYRANAGDYILSPKWGYAPKPESIEGVCKVLEIPLNLRYDIISGNKSRLFAGAGLSSYYMRGEKYKYNYKYPDDPHIKYPGWQGKTGWYLFSHLNASAGYEYRLSDKLSLVAEPYVRMPLKRVGYGKVNLFTTGIWISVRYVPAFR